MPGPDLNEFRQAVLSGDDARTRSVAWTFAGTAEDLGTAISLLKQMIQLKSRTPGEELTPKQEGALQQGSTVFLDAWCGPALEHQPRDGLALAEQAARWGLQLSPDVRLHIAESMVSLDDVSAPELQRALPWLAEAANTGQLPPYLQARLVNIACDPANPVDLKESAAVCLSQIGQLQEDAEQSLVQWLRSLPDAHWPRNLLGGDGLDLASVWQRLARDLRGMCDACLLGSTSRCVRDIKLRHTAFVGHPYAAKIRAPLRSAISDALAGSTGLTVVYADQVQKNGALSCKICQEIRSATVTLFDLTPECRKLLGGFCRRAKANPNVSLELGLAYAYGKPAILFAQAGCRLPVDLAGHEIEYFATYSGLSKGLTDRVKALL